MHKDIKDSGLAELLEIQPMTGNADLAKFIGQTVRYKRELLTPEFVRAHGTLARDELFVIKEVQKTHSGKPALRGYFNGDDFGRCIDPNHVELVQ